MSRPTDVGTYGEALYEKLTPLAYDDEAQDWALLLLCGAIGEMYQDTYELVRDTDEDGTDRPGWADLLDIDACPARYLPYLGQFVGARIPSGTDDAAARELVRTPAGQQRCRIASIEAAAKRHLTGTQTVYIAERVDGHAYWITVATITSETPDEAVTLADILSQKPGGILLDYFTTTAEFIDDLDGTIDALLGVIDGL